MRQPKKRSEAWRVCASGGSKKGAHYAAVRSDAALSETRADSAVMLLILVTRPPSARSPARARVECLNAHWFLNLADAKKKIED